METPSTSNNKMALISMICGLAAWLAQIIYIVLNLVVGLLTMGIGSLCLLPIWFLVLIGWVVAVITGHMGIKQIKESGGVEGGRGMAVAGLFLGYLGLGLMLFGCLAIIILSIAGVGIPFIGELLQELGWIEAYNYAWL